MDEVIQPATDGRPGDADRAVRGAVRMMGHPHHRLKRGAVWLFALCLWTSLTLLPACSNTPAEPEVWVAFGDSLTSEYPYPDMTEPLAGTWPELVDQALPDVQIFNKGTGGATTQRGLQNLQADVISKKPRLVFILFGANDQAIMNGRQPGDHRVSPKQFWINLRRMVRTIHNAGANVVLMTIRPIIQGPGAPEHNYYLDRNGDGGVLYTNKDKVHGTVRQYNNIIRAVANREGTFLIDIWQAMVTKAGGSDSDEAILKLGFERLPPDTDGIHLGPDGYRFIADQVLAALPAIRKHMAQPPRAVAGTVP
ncbi:MAG: SGNH/GDSL hydrolase family protein [Leptospirillia bacterium]